MEALAWPGSGLGLYLAGTFKLCLHRGQGLDLCLAGGGTPVRAGLGVGGRSGRVLVERAESQEGHGLCLSASFREVF